MAWQSWLLNFQEICMLIDITLVLEDNQDGTEISKCHKSDFLFSESKFLNIYLCTNRFNQINAIFSCGLLQLVSCYVFSMIEWCFSNLYLFFNTTEFFQTKSYTETCIKPRKVERLLLWWTVKDVPFQDLPFSMGLVNCQPILPCPPYHIMDHGRHTWKTNDEKERTEAEKDTRNYISFDLWPITLDLDFLIMK